MAFARLKLVLVAFAALALAPTDAKTLRVAPHSDLKIVDPIGPTPLITVTRGYMIYDPLCALDEKLKAQPQMVDRHITSDDKLTWTFVLRDGLAWHDGMPVTAE